MAYNDCIVLNYKKGGQIMLSYLRSTVSTIGALLLISVAFAAGAYWAAYRACGNGIVLHRNPIKVIVYGNPLTLTYEIK